MTTSPKVPNITLYTSPRERCVRVDGKISIGRKASSIKQHEGWKKAKDLEEIK
jgi:hypothetical protein